MASNEAAMAKPEKCGLLRKLGNESYKAGRLREATEYYQQAVAEDPQDPSPHSNLSAVYYEIGKYDDCVKEIHRTLDLSGADRERIYQKLATRLAKSHLQLKDIETGKEVLSTISGLPGLERLHYACRHDRLVSNFDSDGKQESRRKLLLQLPRYLPTILPATEYYVVGHDEACPQIDASMMDKHSTPLSFFFGGIGDARNLYATILRIDQLERGKKKQCKRRYHCTINDIKAAALARDLLLFQLLDELMKLDEVLQDQRTEVLTTIFFLYAGVVVPPYVADKIQATIQQVIQWLRSGTSNLDWVHIYERDKPALLRPLQEWKGEMPSQYTSQDMTQAVIKHYHWSNNDYVGRAGRPKSRRGCEQEIIYFQMTGAHWPPSALSQRQEPNLPLSTSKNDTWKGASAYIHKTWKPNVTMLDPEWRPKSIKQRRLEGPLAIDPFELSEALYSLTGLQEPNSTFTLFDLVSHFFVHVAMSLKKLRGRIQMEIMHGEISKTIECIRYNVSEREHEFPSRYDRIHMSNIPDYVGGPMMSFTFALPLTKTIMKSTITSTCLRNTPVWADLPQFYNEYLLVSEDDIICKLMNVTRVETERERVNNKCFRQLSYLLRKAPDIVFGNASIVKMLEKSGMGSVLSLGPDELRKVDLKALCTRDLATVDLTGDSSNVLAEYFQWQRVDNGSRDYESLHPRAFIQKWLFALFFKIVLPVDRSDQDWDHSVISCPLNLTMIFRALVMLHEVGYPSHWLSEVVEQILENNVITSARPPQSSPLTIEESQRVRSMKKLSTAPFVFEMSTLAALFEPNLPFLIASSVKPKPSGIYDYRIHLEPLYVGQADLPVNILVFFNEKLMEDAVGFSDWLAPPSVRPAMHPESSGSSVGSSAKKYGLLRERGLRVFTTFIFDSEDKKATAWMPEEVMEEMRKGHEWHVGMWRTDNWICVALPVPVGERYTVTKGDRWFK